MHLHDLCLLLFEPLPFSVLYSVPMAFVFLCLLHEVRKGMSYVDTLAVCAFVTYNQQLSCLTDFYEIQYKNFLQSVTK